MEYFPSKFVLCFLIAFIAVPCSVLALSAGSRVSVLASHNNYRSQLAKGTADNRGQNAVWQQFDPAKYVTSIESVAQKWAKGCSMSHSGSSGLGENLYMTSSPTISEADALKEACDMWWAELKQFGFQESLVLDMDQFNKGIGHWSQQARATTAQIGCAMARCPSSKWKTWVVCNYKEAGNILNQPVYKKGTACSNCSDYKWATCDSASGLCKLGNRKKSRHRNHAARIPPPKSRRDKSTPLEILKNFFKLR